MPRQRMLRAARRGVGQGEHRTVDDLHVPAAPAPFVRGLSFGLGRRLALQPPADRRGNPPPGLAALSGVGGTEGLTADRLMRPEPGHRPLTVGTFREEPPDPGPEGDQRRKHPRGRGIPDRGDHALHQVAADESRQWPVSRLPLLPCLRAATIPVESSLQVTTGLRTTVSSQTRPHFSKTS